MLGHSSLKSTETYTHVAIGKLKQVHSATHPADVPDGFADSCMGAVETAALAPFAAQMDAAADRLPGYPGKARQEKAPHRRPHKTYEWKERLVRNAGTRSATTSASAQPASCQPTTTSSTPSTPASP